MEHRGIGNASLLRVALQHQHIGTRETADGGETTKNFGKIHKKLEEKNQISLEIFLKNRKK